MRDLLLFVWLSSTWLMTWMINQKLDQIIAALP